VGIEETIDRSRGDGATGKGDGQRAGSEQALHGRLLVLLESLVGVVVIRGRCSRGPARLRADFSK
jgi:hypothetical protein